MKTELQERRGKAAERHDAALTRYPTREGAGFRRELQAVIDELSALTQAADVPSSDPVEVAKTYRWLGDAFFDLGQGKDDTLLTRGAQVYERAEQLLADAEAPVEQAKLNFNYGNTLRGLSEGFDVGLLEATQARYESAVRVFKAHHLPDLAAMVDEQLKSIDPQLRLARKRAELERGQKRLDTLGEKLKGAGAVEREHMAKELEELKTVRQRGAVAETLGEAMLAVEEQVRKHPGRFGDTAGQFGALKDNIAALTATLEDTVSEQPANVAGGSDAEILRLLMDRLQKEKAEGKVSDDRAGQLAGILKQFGEAMSGEGDDLGSMGRKLDRMRQLTQQVMDKAMTPSWSTPDPAPGSRAITLVSVLHPLKQYLLAEKGRALQPAEETAAATDLLTRLAMLEMRIRESASDEKRIPELEGEVWRIAVETQAHARRHHLILARPVFAVARIHAKPQSLFLSGGDELVRTAEALADRHGFDVFSRPRQGDYAQERWNQLCSATVAVFDLGVPAGKMLAQVCYELGLALALGKPSVVVAPPRQRIPFDVNLRPVSLSGDRAVDQLDDAIRAVLGSIVWGGVESGLGQGLRDALAWLDRHFGARLGEGLPRIARQMAERNQDDATAFRRELSHLLGLLGADAPVTLLPAWPPAYPDPKNKPRCFHVMPFGQKWSGPCRELVRKLCSKHGWKYSRGDEALDQRIIRAIWTEVAGASAVLVDITGHNANVALELGLVHALGRPYRVVSQDSTEIAKFPGLEKVQIHQYEGAPGFTRLAGLVAGLLDAGVTCK